MTGRINRLRSECVTSPTLTGSFRKNGSLTSFNPTSDPPTQVPGWPAPLAPPAPELAVVIPARNEADLILSALPALRNQRDATGQALDPASYEVLVLANNCTDATATLAREFGEQFLAPPVRVAEVEWPAEVAHVGTARRWLMDQAADRLEVVGRPSGLILSTDADTVVAPDWIDANCAEVQAGADAVAGLICLKPSEFRTLPPAVRRAYRLELAYRSRILQLEATLDPNPLDPDPGHDFHGGASLAITARTYRAVGGLPALRSLEDVALAEALWRADARFVHSRRVQVWTSPRVDARATGGFGTALTSLGLSPEDSLVRSAAGVEEEFRTRHALRLLFQAQQAARSAGKAWEPEPIALDRLSQTLGIATTELAQVLRRELTLGCWLENLKLAERLNRSAKVPIREAIRGLRCRLRLLRLAVLV